MKSFARMTKLSNVGGRADYITNERKQEAILAKSEPVDWKPYQDFERANQRTHTANNEGRELVIALPNEWAKLPTKELEARANTIAQLAVGKSTDLQWAVHWNHARTNLHIHVIFSERQREKSQGKWDRNIYATEDGKVARTKADRAKDSEGNYILLHRKGEEKGGFTAKDKAYTTKGWLADTKERLKQTFQERWQVDIEKPDYLHQFHEGKGKEAPAIRQKNEVIRAVNRRLNEFSAIGGRTEAAMLPPIKANMKKRYMVIPHFKDGSIQLTRFQTPQKALNFIQQTEAEWSAGIDSFRQPERTPVPTRTPEPPTFSFTAVLEAQKGYYEALFAMKDQRKPLDQSIVTAPERFQTAVDEFLGAKARERALRDISDGYKGLKGFLHGSEKKEALADYEKAQRTSERLGKKVADWLSFNAPIQRTEFINFPLDYNGQPKSEVVEKCRAKISQLEADARTAIQNARPSTALEPSPRRLEARRSDFLAEMDKIPLEQRETARELLRANLDGLEQGNSIADKLTKAEVQSLTQKRLPTP
ncbi:MAG: MobA/MobL family protein, partial [Clostridiales bacterium]|nr:MobA/MobL family protein [Clostridiales bacterium]